MKVRITIDNFPSDLVGECDLPALPPIGSKISVIDKNANWHWLEVTDIRQHAIRSESEMRELQRELSFDVTEICTARTQRWGEAD